MWGIAIERPAAAPVDEVFHLWPENVPAWRLWHAVQTEWRRSDMAGREGLDKAGVEAEMRWGEHRVRPKDWRRMWADLRLMERTALRVWRTRRR